MQVKNSIQKVLQQVAPLLRITASRRFVELSQEQGVVNTQRPFPFSAFACNALARRAFHLRFFASVCFGQNASELTRLLHNCSGFILIICQMKGIPPGGQVNYFAQRGPIRT